MKLRLIFHLLGFFIISLQFSCNLAGDVSTKEIKRLRSPDHKVDAVLIEADAGATTSTSGKIFIVKSGKKITTDDFPSTIFNCDSFSGLDIIWKGNKNLSISYNTARVFNQLKLWRSEEVDDNNYVVNITLNHIQ